MYEIFEKLLTEKKVKPIDVSRATGISASTLSDWKKGKSTPKADKLQKIADYFNISLEYLTTGKEKDNNLDSNFDNEIMQIAKKIANNKNLFTLFNIAQNATPKAINNATNELKMTIQSENQLDSTTLYTYTPDDSDDPNEQNILDVIADNIEKYSHSDISMYYTPFHVPTLAELREIADDLHISINNLLCPEPFSPNEIKSNYFFCQLQQNDISAHFIAGNESKIVLSQNDMHYIIPSNLYDTFYSSLDDFFSLNVKTLILHAEKKYYSLSDAIYYCSLHKN